MSQDEAKPNLLACPRCGWNGPYFMLTDEAGEIAGCCECPDAHVFEDGFCLCCDMHYMNPKITNFCEKRRH